MPARIGTKPLTNAQKQRRARNDRQEYLAALETAVIEAWLEIRPEWTRWPERHAATIARARKAVGATPVPEPTVPPAPPKAPTPKPRVNAPQTLARTVVRPMFKGKPPK